MHITTSKHQGKEQISKKWQIFSMDSSFPSQESIKHLHFLHNFSMAKASHLCCARLPISVAAPILQETLLVSRS
ncbi:hypothetical protein I7I48_08922 [Histoplasma ohiense]|nr:hypothetical protein I7I48_08922 [Histoplasma ohiense (nom. inval.)]